MRISKKEMEEFFKFTNGERIEDDIVQKVEKFLFDWVNQDDMNRELMSIFAEIMKRNPEYVYEGEIYRGLFDDGREDFDIYDNLYDSAVSFTDYKNVALKFAGIENEDYEVDEKKSNSPIALSYLIEGYAKDAFSFDDFLINYMEISRNEKLIDRIESFVFENEKIHTDEDIKFTITNLSEQIALSA